MLLNVLKGSVGGFNASPKGAVTSGKHTAVQWLSAVLNLRKGVWQ